MKEFSAAQVCHPNQLLAPSSSHNLSFVDHARFATWLPLEVTTFLLKMAIWYDHMKQRPNSHFLLMSFLLQIQKFSHFIASLSLFILVIFKRFITPVSLLINNISCSFLHIDVHNHHDCKTMLNVCLVSLFACYLHLFNLVMLCFHFYTLLSCFCILIIRFVVGF